MLKGQKANDKKDEQRSQMLEAVLAAMDEKGLSWTQLWDGTALLAYNAVSGRRYNGLNRVWLAGVATAKGYKDPRWVTLSQLKRLAALPGNENWSWKGQRCTYVEKWGRVTVYEGQDGNRTMKKSEAKVDDNGSPVVKYSYHALQAIYPVINMAQVEGAPAWKGSVDERNGFDKADHLIETAPCPVVETVSQKAYYSPMEDKVVLPLRPTFESPEAFTAVLAHELSHATGRHLGRDNFNFFGTPEYAFEELVAEMSCAIVCAEIGVETVADMRSVEQHACYLQSWKKALREEDGDKTFTTAIAEASKAADFILERYGLEALPVIDGADEVIEAAAAAAAEYKPKRKGRRSRKNAA